MATLASTPRTTTVTLATASAGPFNVGFRLFDEDTLEVYVDGGVRGDYTLSANFNGGFDDAATISFPTALAIGTVIVIDSALTPRRDSDYLAGDPSLVTKLNVELARIWSALADLKRDTRRSLRGFADLPAYSEFNLTDIAQAETYATTAQSAASAVSLRFFDSQAEFEAATIPAGVDLVFITIAGEVLAYRREPGASGPQDIQHPDTSDWAKSTLAQADLIAVVEDAISAAEFPTVGSGTWEPVITAEVPGSMVVSYGTTRRGRWLRFGDMVFAFVNLNTASIDSITGASGTLRVSLPASLPANALGGGGGSFRVMPTWMNLAISGQDVLSANPTVAAGNDYVEFTSWREGGGNNKQLVTTVDLGVASILSFFVMYEV